MKKAAKLKISLPKVSLGKIDWSKWNFRKLNWLTVVSILSYLNILFVIPLFFARKSKFAQFHARQGMVLFVFTVVFSFSLYLPLLPWILAVFLVASLLIGIINVVTGHERKLPIIGKLAS